MLYLLLFCVFLPNIFIASSNRVFEINERFPDIRNEGVWLVKFYVPWCGHCKNLEPIWNQVAQSLVDTEIRVAKVDCTSSSNLASIFKIRGYPTILFIKGHKVVEYKGDRTRQEIIDFVRRINGPSVRHISKCEDVALYTDSQPVSFVLFEGDFTKENENLKNEYQKLAENYQDQVYFYTAPVSCFPDNTPSSSQIHVFKDRTSYIFEENEELALNETLADWVNKERFPSFVKITYGNFNQLVKTGKKIVMAVLEENVIGGYTMRMTEFKGVIEAIAFSARERYHDHFVFGYLGQPNLANSIAMSVLPIPSLLVMDSGSKQYHLPEYSDGPPTPQAVVELLDKIMDKTAPAYGGTGFFYNIYGAYFEIKTSLVGMWHGNPMLTLILLGLPLGILSIIIYTTCCTGIMEEDFEEEGEPEAPHEKKE